MFYDPFWYFAWNLPITLKICQKHGVIMGKFKSLDKKDTLKIAVIFGIIAVPLIFAFSI